MKSKIVIFCLIFGIFGSQAESNRLNVWHIYNLNMLDVYKIYIIKCRKNANLMLNKEKIWVPNLEERLICKYFKIKYKEDENELYRDMSMLDLNVLKTEIDTYRKDTIETIVEFYTTLLLDMIGSNPDKTFDMETSLDLFYISRNAITECLKRYILNPKKRDKVNEILQKFETCHFKDKNFFNNAKKFFEEIKTEKDFVLAVIEFFEKSYVVYALKNKYFDSIQKIMQAKHHFININIKDISQKEKFVEILNSIESGIDKEQSDLNLICINLLPWYLAGEEELDSKSTELTYKLELIPDLKKIKIEFLNKISQKNKEVSFVTTNGSNAYDFSQYAEKHFDKLRLENTKEIHETLINFFSDLCDENSKNIDIISKARINDKNMFKALQIYFSDSQEPINDGKNFENFKIFIKKFHERYYRKKLNI